MDAVVRLSTKDREVRRLVLEHIHMLRTPASLFHPRIVLRVLKRACDAGAGGRDAAAPSRAVGGAAPDFSS